jgi:hypothetical protein
MEAAGCSADAVIALYFRRWAVETHYRDEKTSLDIETFHSQADVPPVGSRNSAIGLCFNLTK